MLFALFDWFVCTAYGVNTQFMYYCCLSTTFWLCFEHYYTGDVYYLCAFNFGTLCICGLPCQWNADCPTETGAGGWQQAGTLSFPDERAVQVEAGLENKEAVILSVYEFIFIFILYLPRGGKEVSTEEVHCPHVHTFVLRQKSLKTCQCKNCCTYIQYYTWERERKREPEDGCFANLNNCKPFKA